MFSQNSVAAVILLAAAAVAFETDVYVDVEQGRLLGQTVDFIENEFINVSMKIDIFKVRSLLIISILYT